MTDFELNPQEAVFKPGRGREGAAKGNGRDAPPPGSEARLWAAAGTLRCNMGAVEVFPEFKRLGQGGECVLDGHWCLRVQVARERTCLLPR